jgi:hypothetical protein
MTAEEIREKLLGAWSLASWQSFPTTGPCGTRSVRALSAS